MAFLKTRQNTISKKIYMFLQEIIFSLFPLDCFCWSFDFVRSTHLKPNKLCSVLLPSKPEEIRFSLALE